MKKTFRKSVTLFAAFVSASHAFAEETTQQLKIHTGFLQSPSYTVNNQSKQPLYSGMKLHPDFEKVLSENPAALKEAKAAERYNGFALLGSGVMLAGTVMLLMDTLQQKDDVESGDLSSSNDTDWTPVYVVAAGAGISLISTSALKRHINKAVSLYNSSRVSQHKSGIQNFWASNAVDWQIKVLPDQEYGQWKMVNTFSMVF